MQIFMNLSRKAFVWKNFYRVHKKSRPATEATATRRLKLKNQLQANYGSRKGNVIVNNGLQ
jgi:hypothetical protein